MRNVAGLFEQYEHHAVANGSDDDAIEAAVVVAHPDDEIILSVLLAAARNYKMRFHGITMSRGEETTKNYLADEGFDPKKWHRSSEAETGAASLGFATHMQLEGTDGHLVGDMSRQVEEVAQLLVARNVDLVLTTTKMSPQDSVDHMTAGMVAFQAAELVAHNHDRHVGVLVVQPGNRGQVVAESYAESLDIVGTVAVAHRSQFRAGLVASSPLDWEQLSDQHAMHPDDWKELQQYPLDGVVTHNYAKFGQLLVPQLVTM